MDRHCRLSCSQDFGKFLQDSIPVIRFFDAEFALPQNGMEIEKNL
jgi:hypothetical protein